MRTETLEPGATYRALLGALARDVGMAADAVTASASGPLGLSFSADGQTCRLLPHPSIEDRLVVEVSACTLDAAAQGLANAAQVHEFLNRLNAQARLEHDWVATVDEQDEVLLWTWREVRAVTAAGIQELLAEGLERAQALAAALGAAVAAGPAQASGDAAPGADMGANMDAAWSPQRG